MGKKLDNEWVFLNLENGVYYGLNETGSIFWDELKSQKSTETALDRLEKIFEIDRPTLERDFKQLLKELKKEGLIEIESIPEKT